MLIDAFTEPLEWLLATAGPAVVAAPRVTQALLQLCQDLPADLQEAVPGIAFRRGMQLSAAQLVAAAKQRLRGMDRWIDAVGRQSPFSEFGKLGDEAAMAHYIVRFCGPPSEWSGQNESLVRTLASAQLQDLLLIAVNLSNSWQAECIQDACRENNRLMYAQGSSSSSSSSAAAGGSSSDSSSNSSMVQLVEHLLTTAMIRGHHALVDGFADAPPAQQLSPQAVAKLLCLRIQLAQPDKEPENDMEEGDAAERAVSGFAALLELPGAKAMQPAELASLVSLARRRGQLRFVQCMIRAVPAAQQLPSRVLCDALLAAGAADRRQLVQELAELQAAQQLAPGDAVRLVKQLLCDSWGEGVYEALEDLEPMQLGSQLTGGELLQLLREAIHSHDGGAALQAGHLRIFNLMVDLPQASVVTLDEFNLYDEYEYWGCVGDAVGQRAVPTLLLRGTSLTIEVCADLARQQGFAVFGVEFSAECFGSNDLVRATTLYGNSTDCNMPCASNATQYVDATYVPPPPPPPAPQGVLSVLNITDLGCWKDEFPPTGRALPTLLLASATMTVDRCAQLAYSAGWAYFGLQYAAECYVGNNLTEAQKFGLATNCDSVCNSPTVNPVGTCGGGLANSLYALPPQPEGGPAPPPGSGAGTPPAGTPPSPVTTLNVTALGCWKDEFPPTGRALTLLLASLTMSVEQCTQLAWSRGYAVAALQYSEECYASTNETRATRFGPATNCDSPCRNATADPPGSCGGGLANSLYRLPPLAPGVSPAPEDGTPVVVVPPAGGGGGGGAPPGAIPVPETTLNVTALGCWKDEFPPTGRALPTLLLASPTMSVEQCTQLAWSRGYALAALQYSEECYAGTNETLATRFGPATNCDSPCRNATADPPGSCGGGLANSLYRLPPLAPGVSPAPEDGAPVVVVPPPVVPPSPVPAGQLSTLNITSLGMCGKFYFRVVGFFVV
ncbi:hypothetical protein OEZ86_008903 [Tetradesmus obliquus]|nr:hypothetical protein OEZ86_008903 [Tetradesmus obliquus]